MNFIKLKSKTKRLKITYNINYISFSLNNIMLSINYDTYTIRLLYNDNLILNDKITKKKFHDLFSYNFMFLIYMLSHNNILKQDIDMYKDVIDFVKCNHDIIAKEMCDYIESSDL